MFEAQEDARAILNQSCRGNEMEISPSASDSECPVSDSQRLPAASTPSGDLCAPSISGARGAGTVQAKRTLDLGAPEQPFKRAYIESTYEPLLSANEDRFCLFPIK